MHSWRGGPRDVIEDGATGLLCATNEPPMLAGAIDRLVADPSLRARMGGAARERATYAFSCEAMAERFATIVGQVIAARG